LDSVIPAEDAPNLYAIPLNLHDEGLDELVLEKLGLPAPAAVLDRWRDVVSRMLGAQQTVRVAIIGKYIKLQDAYLSVVEALAHAGGAHGLGVELDWVDSENLTDVEAARRRLADADGVLVLPGFGHRGAEGKIEAARYARESGTPYLGLCLGMQIEVIEFARNVAGLEMANSTEFEQDTPHPVIDIMPDQVGVEMGGTMRLGRWPCELVPGTLAAEIYDAHNKSELVHERHRHRYEVNNMLRRRLEDEGLVCSGTSPDERLVEVIELPDHPFFVASQFHPEFNSRPNRPEPLFREFVGAAARHAAMRPPAEAEVAVPRAEEPSDVEVRRPG
jgi:CTP synthase